MKKILLGLIVVAGCYLFLGEAKSEKEGIPLKVYFLDVGQGDAILIDYLSTYQILIDAGPSGEKLLKALGEKMPWGDKKIEIALLTHPDQDHMGGFLELLNNFQIDLFLTNGQEPDSQNFLTLKEKIAQKKIEQKAVYSGSSWQVGKLLDFIVLNPDQDNSQNKEEKNDQSVIVQMNFGQNSFLFAADAEKETEKGLIDEGSLEDIDWLKVAHHGSKNASSEEFLSKVRPEWAVISVGKNSYGHPTAETLDRLEKIGTEVFRTDQMGTISVFCLNLKEKCQKVE